MRRSLSKSCIQSWIILHDCFHSDEDGIMPRAEKCMAPYVLFFRSDLERGLVIVGNLPVTGLRLLEGDPWAPLRPHGNEAPVEVFASCFSDRSDHFDAGCSQRLNSFPGYSAVRVKHAEADALHSPFNDDVRTWRCFPMVTAWFQIEHEEIRSFDRFMKRREEVSLRVRQAESTMTSLRNYFVLSYENSPNQSTISDQSSSAFSEMEAVLHVIFQPIDITCLHREKDGDRDTSEEQKFVHHSSHWYGQNRYLVPIHSFDGVGECAGHFDSRLPHFPGTLPPASLSSYLLLSGRLPSYSSSPEREALLPQAARSIPAIHRECRCPAGS